MREMKDSGIRWIGCIPSSWGIEKLKFHLVRHEPRNPGDKIVLSLYRELGVIPKDSRNDNHNVTSEDTSKYKYVRPGDFVINKMKAWQGSVAVSDYEGIVSPAYFIYSFTDDVYFKRYFHYLLRGCYKDEFMRLSGGIRVGQWDLPSEALDNVMVLIPPLPGQRLIADFLDAKCAEIDLLSANIQAQIDILEQYKRSVITEAVTKGLNPNVEMKDSGVPWIGMLPTHWEVKKTKFLFEIVKRIAGREGFDVLSVTQKGLKVKDLTDYSGQIAENYSGYQFVYPTDYVMNHMDLLTGWVDCSKQFGVTSPDYRVFRLLNKDEHNLDYFKYIFQCLYMNKVYYSFGNGVSGLGRWRLQASTFLNFFLPVPPCAEQHQIAAYISKKVSKIEEIIEEKRSQLSVLDLYKKSLIFEYVTGKKEVSVPVAVVSIDPHVPLLAMVVDMLKKPRGEVVDQKLLYLCDVYLGLGLSTQYYRWDYGPLDLQLYSYIDTLVSNGWYKVDIQNKAKILVKAENHAEAPGMYGNQFSQHKSSIEKLIQYFGEMRMGEIERFATLFAVWNDFIIDGIAVPSDNQIIDDALTNWGPKKERFSRSTWQNTLMKMKRDGIIPKGLGLHTLPKPEGGKSDA